MPVKQAIPYNSGLFFITFTSHKWLWLIDKVNGYDIIYKWFDLLKASGHFINGYIIMPNHVHVLISFEDAKQNINTIIGKGKDLWLMKSLTGCNKIRRSRYWHN